jgi:hypothetical protein
MMENSPNMKKEIEVAPEIVARFHPNSAWRGLKNIPKLELIPCITTSIRAEAATMT